MCWKVLPLTREWIEMIKSILSSKSLLTFSLLRGSGLKYFKYTLLKIKNSSPSYEGVDWNSKWKVGTVIKTAVLPLTREWIEIRSLQTNLTSPLFSLLRGSGLKSYDHLWQDTQDLVLPLTREWIEITKSPKGLNGTSEVLPLTREWIEIRSQTTW